VIIINGKRDRSGGELGEGIEEGVCLIRRQESGGGGGLSQEEGGGE
jgi:hypothetical protein